MRWVGEDDIGSERDRGVQRVDCTMFARFHMLDMYVTSRTRRDLGYRFFRVHFKKIRDVRRMKPTHLPREDDSSGGVERPKIIRESAYLLHRTR